MKKTLNYNDFKNEVMANIKTHLSEEYQDYDMKLQTIRKSSGIVYDALMVGPTGRNMSVVPALNLTEAYRQYEEGMSMEEILDKLADIRMNAPLPDFNKEDMFEYDKIKDRVFPRLINTQANAEYLSDKPHRAVEDLSLIYAVRVSEDSQGFAEAVITDDLADMWGVTPDEIHDKAMDNIATRPPLFQNIESLLFGGQEALEIEEIEPSDYNLPFFVLTNQQKTKGAVMAVNPKTMDRITAKFGDVYVIPSSVDETLIGPKSAVEDVHELERIVRQVNSSDVRPEDQLSDNVYEYDKDTHTLKIAGAVQTEDEVTDMTEGPDEAQNGPSMGM